MFDLFFDSAIAFEQAMMLVVALLCMGLGALLLGYEIHRRIRALRVTGTIIGVREMKPGMYRNVYRYMLPSGQIIEGTSDTGSNSTTGRQTGRTVELLVFADQPERASEARSLVAGIFGVFLLVCGLWPLYVVLTKWPVTPLVWMILAGLVGYMAMRFRRHLVPESERKSLPQWKQERHDRSQAELQAVPVRPIEAILASRENSEHVAMERKKHRLLGPVLLLAGIALVGLGIYLGHETAQLSSAGERAAGHVVAMRPQSDSDGTTYRAVVRFEVNGTSVEFEDRLASNPPSHRVGDAVTVLYLAGSPSQSATIDRGFWNWLPPVGVALFGVLLCWSGRRFQAQRDGLHATMD